MKRESDIDQGYQGRYFNKGSDDCGNACPEFMPNTEIANAVASSKLLLAAVKEGAVVFSYPAPNFLSSQNETGNIRIK